MLFANSEVDVPAASTLMFAMLLRALDSKVQDASCSPDDS